MITTQPSLFPEITQTKVCAICNLPKSLSAFHKWAASPDGYTRCCKQCKSEYDRGYYRNNEEKIKTRVRVYRQTEQGKEVNRRSDRKYSHSEKGRAKYRRQYQTERFKKTRAEYLKRPDVRERDNKCKRKYAKSKRGRQVNRAWSTTEERKAWRREQYAQNPWPRRIAYVRRKARKNNVPGQFSEKDIQSIYDTQGGRCIYGEYNPACKQNLGDNDFHIDHIIPLSRGELEPTNWPDNIQLLCAHCNTSKGNKTHEEYMAWLRGVYGQP